MRNSIKQVVMIVIVVLAVLFLYDFIRDRHAVKNEVYAQSALIEKQLRNVSKLVVIEASYAKVYNYENKETYGLDIFSSQKNALIISNAKAQVAYNLRELKYDVNAGSKTITINYIPKAELTIDPNLQFYRIENGYFNKFNAKDLNSIKVKITNDLRKQILKSEIMSNAENRLLSELSQIFVLTSSLEWQLVYNGNEINDAANLKKLLP